MQGERAALARDVLQAIGSSLVSDTKSFAVETEMEGDSVTVFALRCAANDKGQLVGQGGKMFRALLSITAAIGSTKGEQLSISEVRRPYRPAVSTPRNKPVYDPDWPRASVQWLASAVCSAVFSAKAKAEINPMPRGGVVLITLDRVVRMDPTLLAAIRTVFRAIGINHGCELLIDFKT